jgi:hypothetical protein
MNSSFDDCREHEHSVAVFPVSADPTEAGQGKRPQL